MNLRKLYVSGRVELLAPDLLVYEVANALRFNPYLDVSDVERAVEAPLNFTSDCALRRWR